MNTALRRAVARRSFSAMIIKDADAYFKLRDELRSIYKTAWNDSAKRAVARAIDTASQLGSAINQREINIIHRVLANDLGGEAMLEQLRRPTVNLGGAIYKTGAKEVLSDVRFQVADLDALEQINQGNLFWVGRSYDANTHDLIETQIESLFRDGMTRDQLADALANSLPDMQFKGGNYFDLLADHNATKTREMGRVTGYERAGITVVKVQAFLDDKTSATCRAMHGRLIQVSAMAQQRKHYLDALQKKDVEAAISAWKMNQSPSDIDKKTALPPYHFKCRTITIAYQPVEGEWTDTPPPVPPPIKPSKKQPRRGNFTNTTDPEIYRKSGAKIREDILKTQYKGKPLIESITQVGTKADFSADDAAIALAFQGEFLKRLAATRSISTPAKIATSGKGAHAVKLASQRFPDDWTKMADKAGDLHVRYSSKGRGWQWTAPHDGRYKVPSFGGQHVSSGKGFIVTDESTIAAHEYAHRIQATIPRLDAIFQDIHKMRTQGDKLQRLADILPMHGYSRQEFTRKDGYYNAYQGREYDGENALEVMTMAIEPILGNFDKYLLRSTKKFFLFMQRDQELFDITLGLLTRFSP